MLPPTSSFSPCLYDPALTARQLLLSSVLGMGTVRVQSSRGRLRDVRKDRWVGSD